MLDMEETENEVIKDTPLRAVHESFGAKMAPFAGYNMPIQYEGVTAEHETVRNAMGIFDVSHMGEFFIRGGKALELIQRATTNDASKLFNGKIQYSCMPNGKGGIVDDLLVYRLSPEEYMLVVNASNIEKDWKWLNEVNQTIGADLADRSEDLTILAVQGPKVAEALQVYTDVDLAGLEYYSFIKAPFAGVSDVIISANGYTGAGGFELCFLNRYATLIWDAVMEAGRPYGIKPIGLGARDTLRLEKGFCLYGNDIDDTTSPIEAGLGWITKFDKGDFTDRDLLLKQKTEGVSRKLVGFEMVERGIPRHDYKIWDGNGQVVGRVTSGTMSPTLKKGIGMGYVPTALSAVDTEIFIDIRGKLIRARVVRLPFLK